MCFRPRRPFPGGHRPTPLLEPTVKRCCGMRGLEQVPGLLWSLAVHRPLPVGPPLGTSSVKPPAVPGAQSLLLHVTSGAVRGCLFPATADPETEARVRARGPCLVLGYVWDTEGGDSKGHSWAAP